jgi:hypothetical protein
MKTLSCSPRISTALTVVLFLCATAFFTTASNASTSTPERLSLDRGLGGELTPFHDGRYAIYRAQCTPRAATQNAGGQLVLRDVVGKAQVWVDGKSVGEKTNAEKQDMTVPFPAGNGERIVSVVIEAPAVNTPAGLGGIVTIE